ncbi:MAG: hypothetical protein K2K91_10585 [Ruminococcus sp.]|nr:hypothetical protein [Ruminococcus sp.]MDE7098744.1 hypothetical protein [Ruminococcus sp.]
MKIKNKAVFMIAVIGIITCLISFVLSLIDSNGFTDAIVFGIAMLFCISAVSKLVCRDK